MWKVFVVKKISGDIESNILNQWSKKANKTHATKSYLKHGELPAIEMVWGRMPTGSQNQGNEQHGSE